MIARLFHFYFQDDGAEGLEIDGDVAVAGQRALDLLAREQVDGRDALALLQLQIVEGMGGDGDIHRGGQIVEVDHHKQHL